MRATLVLNGLNTRFDKYGPMIHKMHAFVPSVSGMVKVEKDYKTEETIHEYIDALRTPRKACVEYSRQERRQKAVPKENQPDSIVKVLKVCHMDL